MNETSRSFLRRRGEAKEERTLVNSVRLLAIVWIMIVIVEISKGQHFSIDNQLRIFTNDAYNIVQSGRRFRRTMLRQDCYTRIAIGSRLPERDVVSTIVGNSLSDCEAACSINGTVCNAFSFGIDAGGNGTCETGRTDANVGSRVLTVDPDYDVYERRAGTSRRGCRLDRLSIIGHGDETSRTIGNSSGLEIWKTGNLSKGRRRTPFGDPFVATDYRKDEEERRRPSVFRGGWHSPIADDTDARLYDIVNDREKERDNFDDYPGEDRVYDPRPDRAPAGSSFDAPMDRHGSNERFSTTSLRISSGKISKKDSANDETRGRQRPFPAKVVPTMEKSTPCYRKLYAGKRLSENHVRRNVPCDGIEECHRVCEYESTFVCEGFNYGETRHEPRYGTSAVRTCQLASVSSARMDPRRDFVEDSRYDYYERDCSSERRDNRGGFERDYRPNPSNPLNPTRHRHRQWWPLPPLPPQNVQYYYTRDGLPRHRAPHDDRYDPRYDGIRYEDIGKYGNGRIEKRRGWAAPRNDIASPRVIYEYRTDRPIRENDDRIYSAARRESSRDHDYGYNYGHDYGDRTNWKPGRRGHNWIDGGSRDCSVRSATGFKISRKIVGASRVTANLEECETLCSTRADCHSFAYRYSLAATAPTDNCLLGNVRFQKLNFYTDLEPDRDYDVYAIVGDTRNCDRGLKKPHGRSSEECFWRVRSGCGMPPSLTRKEIRVENGPGECQIACVEARRFTCRSFVFRYDSEGDRDGNCFLSDCPTSEIVSAAAPDGNVDSQPRNRLGELYERGSYGRGCEAYPFATIYDPVSFLEDSRSTDRGCYSGYDGGCKLSPYVVSSESRVESENECRRRCSRTRHGQRSSPCMSFSFRVGDEGRGDNCYLSDVSGRDLRPGLDYTYDHDYVMYAWKELAPRCLSAPYDTPRNDGRFNYDANFPSAPTTGSPPFRSLFHGYDNSFFDGVRPLDRPDFVGHVDSIDSIDSPEYPIPPSPHRYQTINDGYSSHYLDDFASFNRRYTVNGYPCKRGTECQKNRIVGFWSCEPEGSELGSWDYCCEPNHHCGYSQGHRYPWCYVGPSEDQWRPCSDKYYPYLPSARPAVTGSPRPDDRRDHPDRPDHREPSYRHEKNGRTIEDCWSITDQGRHWPIAFLHPIPPPNATDSVALADDHRDASGTSVASVKATSEMIMNTSSAITELRDSRTKRRGPVSASIHRTSNNDPNAESFYKKVRQISIITDDIDNNTKNDEDYGRTDGINDRFKRRPNNEPRNKIIGGRLARVERVTKPTNIYITPDDHNNNNNFSTNSSNDVVNLPTDKKFTRPVIFVPLDETKNDSSRLSPKYFTSYVRD